MSVTMGSLWWDASRFLFHIEGKIKETFGYLVQFFNLLQQEENMNILNVQLRNQEEVGPPRPQGLPCSNY